MSKRVKDMLSAELVQELGAARDILVLNTSKLDAVTDNRFRLKLRQQDIHVLSVKNTLARNALKKLGVTGLDEILKGPSALVWGSSDVVALSREITKWAKDIKKIEIKGGAVEGTPIDAAGVVALSKSPGRLELISIIAGLALSPGRRLGAALLGAGGRLAGQVKTLADKADTDKTEADATPAA